MDAHPVFLVAATEAEGKAYRTRWSAVIPDLAKARIVSAYYTKWWWGAAPRRVYVAPGADRRIYPYARTIKGLRWNLRKTSWADQHIHQLTEDGQIAPDPVTLPLVTS